MMVANGCHVTSDEVSLDDAQVSIHGTQASRPQGHRGCRGGLAVVCVAHEHICPFSGECLRSLIPGDNASILSSTFDWE